MVTLLHSQFSAPRVARRVSFRCMSLKCIDWWWIANPFTAVRFRLRPPIEKP
jgi:hypothetical protein